MTINFTQKALLLLISHFKNHLKDVFNHEILSNLVFSWIFITDTEGYLQIKALDFEKLLKKEK